MGLLDGVSLKNYYQGQDLGNYQFVSLNDIITQFQVMYVGEDKLIPKISRADVGFHAQRALAELSFDTFKSFKSQQIDLPPSLVMPMPHDYVNYTKVSWVDGAGIKHPIYPTKHTSNPFQVNQDTSGAYEFIASGGELLTNGNFAAEDYGWQHSGIDTTGPSGPDDPSLVYVLDGVLTFEHHRHQNGNGVAYSPLLAFWQEIDVSDVNQINISADIVSADIGTGTNQPGRVLVGLSESPGDTQVNPLVSTNNFDAFINPMSTLVSNGSGTTTSVELNNLDVSEMDTVYLLITSDVVPNQGGGSFTAFNTVDNLSVINPEALVHFSPEPGFEVNSSTWNNYKANTPSENSNSIEDYRYEQHWLNSNERYGLDPSHAQINGSFYIDQRLGRIHFSSNISGKTVILDYISDSLGTDGEMQVHKLAEDAMYKHMVCDIMGTRANVGRGQLAYYKKDKFAAVRKAKLRLSNIKLEELTQILRGQSKHIKH
tara:strand:+ start:1699 stop:3153 length:1455 start_codon:yes stop_codon:yes gene_type:complete